MASTVSPFTEDLRSDFICNEKREIDQIQCTDRHSTPCSSLFNISCLHHINVSKIAIIFRYGVQVNTNKMA